MWAAGGHAYVYFTYGMHHCMNVVASRENNPVAALIRALEPVEGLQIMAKRRRNRTRPGNQSRRQSKPTSVKRPKPAKPRPNLPDHELCSGPAKLCQALAIERSLDGADLVNANGIYIEQRRLRAYPASHIVVRPRIGVDYAGPWAQKPLRFYLKGNIHVSKP